MGAGFRVGFRTWRKVWELHSSKVGARRLHVWLLRWLIAIRITKEMNRNGVVWGLIYPRALGIPIYRIQPLQRFDASV